MKLISEGAESKIYFLKIFGKEICIKHRISKKYRHPTLDKKIIKTRNKEESFLLNRAKQNGLNTPFVYFVCENKIYMEYLKNTNKQRYYLENIGKEIARLHNAHIIHGDLNFLNILSVQDKIYFIDFGLGFISQKIEDKATDLLVLKKTLLSQNKTKNFWEKIENAYLKETHKKQIIKKIKEIESRARYL